MAYTDIKSRLCSIKVQNKIGGNRGVGSMIMADSHCGDEFVYVCTAEIGSFLVGKSEVGDVFDINGVYRQYHKNGEVYTRKIKWSVSKENPSISLLNNRNKFRNSIIAWHNLTIEQKAVYNIRSKKTRGHGFNLFITEYMRA